VQFGQRYKKKELENKKKKAGKNDIKNFNEQTIKLFPGSCQG